MKNTISISKSFVQLIVIGILIGIIVTSIFFFTFFNINLEERDKLEPNNLDDCKQLGIEAYYKKEDCKLEILREIYGIDYQPNLKDGNSCYFKMSDYICLSDTTAEIYLNAVDEKCSENFPDRGDVFAECLSKIES